MKLNFQRNSPLLSNPWPYFSVFLASHTLLSYFQLPMEAKLCIVLMGLILPLWLAFKSYPTSQDPVQPLDLGEFLPPVPPWLWVAVGSLAVFVRFYKLTTLSVWPHFDEAYLDYFALEFSQKWD